MNRIILKLTIVAAILLWMGSTEAGAQRRKKKNRNRNNRRRNNDYNDDEDDSILGQFSGDWGEEFMKRYYGGANAGSSSSSSILGPSYIDQEDYGENEGSGDDDDDSDNLESSGDFHGDSDDEDFLPKWPESTTISTVTPKRTTALPITTTTTTPTTTTTIRKSTTTTISTTMPEVTFTQSPKPTTTSSDSYEDFVDFDDHTFGNIDERYPVTDRSETYAEGSGSESISGSGHGDGSPVDDEDGYWTDSLSTAGPDSPVLLSTPPSNSRPTIDSKENVTPKVYEDEDFFEHPEEFPDINDPNSGFPTTEQPRDTLSTTNKNKFGPLGPDKVPTLLYDNHLLVVAIYSTLIFVLLSSILIVLCVVGGKRCRRKYGFVRVSGTGEDGSSTDSTASSDLPIIKKRNMIQHKPASGLVTGGLGESGIVRYDDASNRSHYAGGRRGSFSPIAENYLPDLSLPADDYKNENPSKFLDFFKGKSSKNEKHLNRSNNLNSSSRSNKKSEKQNHRDWL